MNNESCIVTWSLNVRVISVSYNNSLQEMKRIPELMLLEIRLSNLTTTRINMKHKDNQYETLLVNENKLSLYFLVKLERINMYWQS